MREEELQELRKQDGHTDISLDTKHQTLTGVEFPLTNEAKQAVVDMVKGVHDYIQLEISEFCFSNF